MQLFEGASDESQDAGDSDSDEYYPSFTILRLLQSTMHLIDGGCQCSPKEMSSKPQKRCVLSLRVRLLVPTLFLSSQNDSVPVASPFDYPTPVAMTPTVQTRSNASKRSRTPSITNKTSKRVKKTTSSARYALDPFFPSRHAFPSLFHIVHIIITIYIDTLLVI